eukprot:m.259965 g.259965  ORF g.259965 m.259965 type:complete len:655 (+) comp19670_c1_seq1:234-2198(+)
MPPHGDAITEYQRTTKGCQLFSQIARPTLLRAVEAGDLLLMAKVLQFEPDSIYERDSEGRNALLVACFNGNIDAAEMLLQGGASLQSDCDTNALRGGKAIHYAAWGGHFHVLKWIIERGAGSLHETDLVGNTPMLYAVYGGHLELIRVLMRMGCSLLERNSKGHSAIIQASCGGHSQIVKWLLCQGASLTERDDVGNTALLFAAWSGHVDVMKCLLAHGASLEETSFTGHTALLSAASSGKREVVEWLLDEHGASLSDRNQNGDTALLLAAFSGHCEFLEWLLSRGMSLEDRNNDGLNAVLSACNGGYREMVELLLKHGGSLNVSTGSGYSPLILAACGGHVELVQWLVSMKCSLDETTVDGDTPLLLACYCGHIELVRWIMQQGGSVTTRNKTGLTPLISAANGGHVQVVDLLLTYGSNLEERDNDGYTALLLAARRGFLPVVQHLLKRGANAGACVRVGEMNDVGEAIQEDIYTLSEQHAEVHAWLLAVHDFPPLHIAANLRDMPMATRLLYCGTSPYTVVLRGTGVTPPQEGGPGPAAASVQAITALDVASSRELGCGMLVCRRMVQLLRQASSPWTPVTHHLFGPRFRENVVRIMLIWQRLRLHGAQVPHLPQLPSELWLRIIAMLPRGHNTPPAVLSGPGPVAAVPMEM